tara:strand:- start:1439 stop:1864 length:426 start_codon:yes stop_codon:yes gene_type:complete
MITLNFDIKNLNNSLQVGDMIYATPTTQQVSSVTDLEDASLSGSGTGNMQLVGVLRKIEQPSSGLVMLEVDNDLNNPINAQMVAASGSLYNPQPNDFLMFSKYSQTDGDVNGYYAEATFKNNSTEKAELFSVGSEITINSK